MDGRVEGWKGGRKLKRQERRKLRGREGGRTLIEGGRKEGR